MPANLEFYEADGITPSTAPNWGKVRPGQTGAVLTRIMKNTGDAPAQAITLGLSPVGEIDLENWVTLDVGGRPLTAAAPLNLGDLAVGASVALTLNLTVPPNAPLSSTPAVALLYADCDES